MIEGELREDDLRELLDLARQADRTILASKIQSVLFKMQPAELVFHLELLTKQEARRQNKATEYVAYAPTLNEYNGLESWQKERLRETIDGKIFETRTHWPRWNCGAVRRAYTEKGKIKFELKGGRKRLVHVTRHSRAKVDECSVDILGGKIPVDRLVHAGIIAGDDERCILRRAEWQPAPSGQGRVVLDVYELPGYPLVPDAKS